MPQRPTTDTSTADAVTGDTPTSDVSTNDVSTNDVSTTGKPSSSLALSGRPTGQRRERNAAMSRRAPDTRWAASFSMVHIAPGDDHTPLDAKLSDLGLAAALEDAAGRVQFRFRFEGRQRAPSMALGDGPERVVEQRAQFVDAIDGDWDLGSDAWPVPPGTATVHVLTRPGRTTGQSEDAGNSAGDGDGDDRDSDGDGRGADGEVLDLFADRPRTPVAPEPATPEEPSLAGTGALGVGRARYAGIGDPPARIRGRSCPDFGDSRQLQRTSRSRR